MYGADIHRLHAMLTAFEHELNLVWRRLFSEINYRFHRTDWHGPDEAKTRAAALELYGRPLGFFLQDLEHARDLLAIGISRQSDASGVRSAR